MPVVPVRFRQPPEEISFASRTSARDGRPHRDINGKTLTLKKFDGCGGRGFRSFAARRQQIVSGLHILDVEGAIFAAYNRSIGSSIVAMDQDLHTRQRRPAWTSSNSTDRPGPCGGIDGVGRICGRNRILTAHQLERSERRAGSYY
jgi:hypothetical protein